MKRLRTAQVLLRHLIRVWRAGQLRFRLETYGLYYPALPYQAPWWKISPRYALLLLRQLPSYALWIEEMDTLRAHGPASWWTRHRRTADLHVHEGDGLNQSGL